MDLGLLLLRLVVAAVLFFHGTQKLLGWFHGPGMATAAVILEDLGQRPGRAMASLAVACELSGAVLLALGALTPLGSAISAGTMFVAGAAMSSARGSVWNAAGGGEYPLVLAAFAAVVGFTGPGRWSLDHALDAPWTSVSSATAAAIGVAAALLALLAAVPPLLRMRRAPEPAPTP